MTWLADLAPIFPDEVFAVIGTRLSPNAALKPQPFGFTFGVDALLLPPFLFISKIA